MKLLEKLQTSTFIFAALLMQVSCGSGASSPSSPSSSQALPVATPAPKPLNVVLIMTDDQEAVSAKEMPRMQALIAAEGVTFENAIATTPLCGPSRATIMSGRYAHNHGIRSNDAPLGGYGKYRESGMEGDSLPVWLKAAGYRTAYLGKYTNGYGPGWEQAPPGWDDWLAFTEPQAYVNFTFNENGKDFKSPAGEYQTDYLATRALDYLKKTEEKDDQPFFLMVSTYAPHNVAKYASRHANFFSTAGAVRTPAFNEGDVSDKPRHIKRIASFNAATLIAIDTEYRNSLRSLLAVDEMIERIVQALSAQGELENTAIIFMSDNGLSTGAHRFTDKTAPYSDSLDIPMSIRVPGGPKGVIRSQLVANIDIPATIVNWARIQTPPGVEGRSLVPLLTATPPTEWRSDMLIEYWDNTNPATTLMPTYQGLRVENVVDQGLYVLHDTEEEEFYDHRKDPWQLDSSVGANPIQVGKYFNRMKELANCRGAACR